MTSVAAILKQRHKELKAMRRLEHSSLADSTPPPSICIANCGKNDQHHPKPCPTFWSSLPRLSLSDLFENSATFVADAVACCSSNTTTSEYYTTDCYDAQEIIHASPRIGEVDIADQEIIEMWHAN